MNDKTRDLILPGYSLRKELTRKVIHITIALVPFMAKWNFVFTVVFLSAGILFYVINETGRISGRTGGFISRMTEMASRPVEQGFVWGPVTLGLGALAALLYYPEPASAVAIYALAFGDGIASVAGKLLARRDSIRIGEKTLIGSVFCFFAVLISAYAVLRNLRLALISAAAATILELLPIRDADNLIIPLGTGLVLTLLM
jgi:dolichol kinase